MSIDTLKRRLERLRRAKTKDTEPITSIVLMPLRREGEPEPTEDECVVIWEAKENRHEHR